MYQWMSLSDELGEGDRQIPDDDFQLIRRGKELHCMCCGTALNGKIMNDIRTLLTTFSCPVTRVTDLLYTA